MKKKTKIFIALMLIAVLTIIVMRGVNFFRTKAQNTYLETHYIFDKNFRTGKTGTTDSSSNKYFSHGMISTRALNLFRLMDQKFPLKSINDLTDHYQAVRQYLQSQFKEAEARKLFGIYQTYLACQIELNTDSQYQAKTADLKQLLALLSNVQNFRRDKMGKETADALFGSEVKDQEYFVRKSMIIVDNALHGKEKESRLRRLKGDMWNNEVIPTEEDDNTYNRYQFKTQLYQKDLSELGEKERGLKIEEFRKEFFTKEQIKKLHEADAQITSENENMDRYREAEKNILNLRDITPAEKDKRIKLLQDEFFGKEAEAFRRREMMRKGLE